MFGQLLGTDPSPLPRHPGESPGGAARGGNVVADPVLDLALDPQIPSSTHRNAPRELAGEFKLADAFSSIADPALDFAAFDQS